MIKKQLLFLAGALIVTLALQSDAATILGGGGGGGGAVSGTTLDPSLTNRDPAIVLSSDKLTATQALAPNAYRTVRSNTSYTVGTNHKVYTRFIPTAIDATNGWAAGFSDNSPNLQTLVGTAGVGLGIQAGSSKSVSKRDCVCGVMPRCKRSYINLDGD
jgi:hypothetical protein